ncbi:MAG: substrate-binding domain-containing protein [Phycisphaerae bacterium]|nr:substrate-binding domain-containing protein [Phycisphaerae bacterium]
MPGSRLPNREAIAERFHVSTRTVRQAIERLVQERVVAPVAHTGIVVTGQNTGPLPVRRAIVFPAQLPEPLVFQEQILLGIDRQCERCGLKLRVCRALPDLADADCLARVCGGDPCEGAWLFVSLQPPAHSILAWRIAGLRVAIVDHIDPGHRVHTVNSDAQAATYQATERLILLGHRRLAFLGSLAVPNWKVECRLEGFKLAHARHGLPVLPENLWDDVSGDPRIARRVVCEGLHRLPVTGIVASNQPGGAYALSACESMGLRVPQDVSVISGGMSRRDLPAPGGRLSRFDEGAPESLGQLAVDVIANARQTIEPVNMLMGVTWADRGSTGPPAK